MKKFLSTLVFVICVGIFNFCSAATLLANISPAEFSVRYQYFVNGATNILGSMAATDYSKYLIQDVWHHPEKKDMYALYINEDYKSGKNNVIYLFAGNNPTDKGIYSILVCVENNFENLRDSLFIESLVSLATLNVTDTNSDRLYRVIDGLDNEYNFFDSTAGKNISIKMGTKKNNNGYKNISIEISAY